MNIKRFLILGVLGIFLVSLIGFALAQDEAEEIGTALGEGALSLKSLIKAFFAVLFDHAAFGEKEMLSRFFFAVLLAMIVYSTIGSFMGANKFVLWISTIAITAIAIIAIPTDFLEAMRTQYGAMGATLLTIIPFAIIAFFTIRVKSLLVGSVTWVFYSLYYFALFGNKLYEGLVKTSLGFWGTTFSPEVLPYLLAVIAGIVMTTWGLVYFRKWFSSGMIEAQMEEASAKVKKRAAGLKAEAERLAATTGIEQS